MNVAKRNMPAARISYETAIDLEPNHAPLLTAYGDFLLRYMDSSNEAYTFYERAHALDSSAFDVLWGMARTMLYNFAFEKAKQCLESILNNVELLSTHNQKKTYDLYMQTFQRNAESLLFEQNYVIGIEELEMMKQVYVDCPRKLIDEKMHLTLRKSLQILHKCLNEANDEQILIRTQALIDWLNVLGGNNSAATSTHEIGAILSGEIIRMPPGKPFGFIRVQGVGQYFFHRSNLYNNLDWNELVEGTPVIFTVGFDDQNRPTGIGVRIVNN